MTDIDSVPLPSKGNWQFVDELKQPERFIFFWKRTQAYTDEADLQPGVLLSEDFPDPKGRLATAYDDLKNFFSAGGICTQG